MKQIECKTSVTYRWWRNDGQDIREVDVDDLRRHASERIAEMQAAGYVSGDLLYTADAWSSGGGVAYTGWWEAVVLATVAGGEAPT